MLEQINGVLEALLLRSGTIVNATMIAALRLNEDQHEQARS